MTPKSMDDQTMRRMSECRVMFVHFVRSFISPAIYKSALDKRVAMSESAF